MALISLPLTTPTPKTVAFQGGSTAGQVLYTVPTGKTWVGTITCTSTPANFGINGVSIYLTVGGSGNSPMFPVTLTSGTVVTWLGNSNIFATGVES